MKKFFVLLMLAMLAAISGGCGSSFQDSEHESVGATAQAVVLSGKGALTQINGTYGASCIGRTGAWSVRISGTDPLPNPVLSVRSNNTACTLTLTDIRDATGAFVPVQNGNGDGGFTGESVTTMPIQTAFQATARKFKRAADVGNSAADFYGNVRVDDLLFDNNFVITVLYSADAATINANKGANRVYSASVTAQQVPAPDYQIDLANLDFEASGNTVLSFSGFVRVHMPATTWGTGGAKIVTGSFETGMTWSDIDAAWHSAGAVNVVESGIDADWNVQGYELLAVGMTVPVSKSILIANVDNGVRSYQVITINLTP